MSAHGRRTSALAAGDRFLRFLLRPRGPERPEWPEGKAFAFTIVDDTDQSTLENIRPVYEWLSRAGMLTTKTVWSLPSVDKSKVENNGHTLADSEYREYMLTLMQRGFEIASHGARGGSSTREITLAGLDEFRKVFGRDPSIYVNHASNRENLYWGTSKLTSRILRTLYQFAHQNGNFEGDHAGSEYFWGDIAKERIKYVVDFSFHEIDMLHINPQMPAYDPAKPFVNAWFQTADGGTVESFVNLLSDKNIERLEKRGGACIVYTHFGKGFCADGQVAKPVLERLEAMAGRNGWFVPASQLLDMLLERRGGLQKVEGRMSRYLQSRWVLEKMLYGAS